MNNITIHLASPRGFCAGVDRAIEIVKKTIKKYGSPIYVRHEIVHNKYVVEDLKRQGAIFVEKLSEIKDLTRPVIFSAHGVPKSVPEYAKMNKISVIDATCPLVSKVHREAELLNKNGFQILLIGHTNHPEVIGTMGQLPKNSVDLIETKDDAKRYKNLSKKSKLAYITQTTLSVDDTLEIIEILKNKFPEIKAPKKDDICYATTNRQLAVKKIAPLCDVMLIVGSKNSSNSLRCEKSFLIDSIEENKIKDFIKFQNVGITSGASAPENLVHNLINVLKKYANIAINNVEVAKENVSFKIPNNLN